MPVTPLCKPFLTKQPRTGGGNAMTFQLENVKQTSTLTLTQCDPPFEKSWPRLCWFMTSMNLSSYGYMLEVAKHERRIIVFQDNS